MAFPAPKDSVEVKVKYPIVFTPSAAPSSSTPSTTDATNKTPDAAAVE